MFGLLARTRLEWKDKTVHIYSCLTNDGRKLTLERDLLDLKALLEECPQGTNGWISSTSSSPQSRCRLDLCIFEILQHHWPGSDGMQQFLSEVEILLPNVQTSEITRLIKSRIIDAVLHWK